MIYKKLATVWLLVLGLDPMKGKTPIRALMYTRQGCHLCDDAWEMLQKLKGKYELDLEIVDVDSQADLVARYGERVPVIVVNGEERFWGRVNAVLMERLFEALRRQGAAGE